MVLIRLLVGGSTLCVSIPQTEVSCRNAQLPEVIQQESRGSSEPSALAGLQLHDRPCTMVLSCSFGFYNESNPAVLAWGMVFL